MASTINFHMINHSLSYDLDTACTVSTCGIYRISIQHHFLYFVYYNVMIYTNTYSSPPPPHSNMRMRESLSELFVHVSLVVRAYINIWFLDMERGEGELYPPSSPTLYLILYMALW